MLCDAACLARDDIGVADSVQKRGLSVVDVPEYADNRRARNVIFNVVLRPFYGLFFLGLLLFAPMPYIEIKSEAKIPISINSDMSLNGFKSIAFAKSRTMIGAFS